MRAFFRGLAKGIIGCTLVLLLAGAVCYGTGFLDGLLPKRRMASVEVPKVQVVEPTREAAGENQEEQDPFADSSQEESLETGSEEIHLLFAGDLFLTELLQTKYQQQGIAAAASSELLEVLEQADAFWLNEEFPFGTTGEAMEEKEYTFRVDPSYVQLLHDLHVDGVTLANNHILDFGTGPLSETLELLNQEQIAHVGAGESLEEAKSCSTFTLKGKTIGILGASRVIPEGYWSAGKNHPGVFTTYDPAALVQEIAKAKESCDYVIVMVHWGIERSTEPEEYQKSMARQYIDAGADAVIGSHPHVIQGMECYQGKPICYSLGNFIFSNRSYETMLVSLTLEENGIQVSVIPCQSEANQMRLMEDPSSFYENLRSLSPGVEIDADGNIVFDSKTQNVLY